RRKRPPLRAAFLLRGSPPLAASAGVLSFSLFASFISGAGRLLLTPPSRHRAVPHHRRPGGETQTGQAGATPPRPAPPGAGARAVFKNGDTCPSLSLKGSAQTTAAMSVRQLPQSGKNAAFPVLVCELAIPAGTTEAKLCKTKLPLPPSTLAAIAVIGDTGCR